MLESLDFKKIAIAFVAATGTIFAMGAVFSDYRDLPTKVGANTDAIHENREAIRTTSEKLDAVLCLLIQDQFADAGAELNPLICLNPGVNPNSFLPGSPLAPGR